MPTYPAEAADQARRKAEFLAQLAKEHPGATEHYRIADSPHTSLWVDRDLEHCDCDFAYMTVMTYSVGFPIPVIWLGKSVGNGYVFTDPARAIRLEEASSELAMKIAFMIAEEQESRRSQASSDV